MKRYRVKVTETLVGYVWVNADSEDQARHLSKQAVTLESKYLGSEVVGVNSMVMHPTQEAHTERVRDKEEEAIRAMDEENDAWREDNYNKREGMI